MSVQQTHLNGESSNVIVGWVNSLLAPGFGFGLLNFTRVVIFVMMVFFVIWPFIDYNIHYVIMAILSFCFFVSFEYLTYHLKKNPELMQGQKARTD
jgi:hypothetical protein